MLWFEVRHQIKISFSLRTNSVAETCHSYKGWGFVFCHSLLLSIIVNNQFLARKKRFVIFSRLQKTIIYNYSNQNQNNQQIPLGGWFLLWNVLNYFCKVYFYHHTYIAEWQTKTKNGGQCTYSCATVHFIWPLCTVNESCTEVIFVCFLSIIFYPNKSSDQW